MKRIEPDKLEEEAIEKFSKKFDSKDRKKIKKKKKTKGVATSGDYGFLVK
jgi:hypothetical protein